MRLLHLLSFFFILLIIWNGNQLETSHFRGGSMTAYASSYNSTTVTMTITSHWA